METDEEEMETMKALKRSAGVDSVAVRLGCGLQSVVQDQDRPLHMSLEARDSVRLPGLVR